MPRSRSAVLADNFKPSPYWWEAAPPEDAAAAPLPAEADVVVVGAGYCGLCCALELAEHGVSVVALEAGTLGAGASTLSGGMVTGGQKFIVSGAIRGVNDERRARILEDARESLTLLEARIASYRLDADYAKSGRVILAEIPRHVARLETWAELFRAHGHGGVGLVARARLAEEIGGDHYHGGLVIPDYGGLHPAKYHRALRDAARSRGAGLHSRAPVEKITRSGRGFVVETGRGTVHAREVFVATNGYTGGLVPYLHHRIVPVASYIIATEPLPAGLAERLSPRRRMFSDTKRSLYYFRLSPDGRRVMFGARPGARDMSLESAAPRLHEQARGVWPELNDVKVEFCWTGFVGMSADHLPHMGVVDGLHYALGCNGSGVAMMSYLGQQTARKILGRQNRPCAFDGLAFPRPPLYRGRPWFVPLVGAWQRARDKLDRALA